MRVCLPSARVSVRTRWCIDWRMHSLRYRRMHSYLDRRMHCYLDRRMDWYVDRRMHSLRYRRYLDAVALS